MPLFSKNIPSRTGPKGFASLYKHFRRILATNNQILEMIADLEQVLGEDYIFDRAFLQRSVTNIIEKGRQVIYHLNALAGDRYTHLYDRFTATSDNLADILAGGPGPFGTYAVLEGDTLHRDLVHLAGGKGANLGEVKNSLKLPTPPLFVLSTTGYHHFMEANSLFEKIDAINLTATSPEERSTTIQALFAAAKLPSDLAKQLRASLKHLKNQAPGTNLFAVRSSAVGEDGERSFAGQFHTRINVGARELESAIIEVIASRFSERLLRYIENETDVQDIPMAVVVQAMVKAKASGVLYTRDPNHPNQQTMVLSAAPGQGETIVSGLETGNRFILDSTPPFKPKSSEIQPSQPLAGQTKIVMEKLSGGTLRRGSAVIGMATIKQLAEFGHRLEKRFQWPQDIEWCVDENDKVWLLQARPLALKTDMDFSRTHQIVNELAHLPILLEKKGAVCQLGLACGPVVHVSENTLPESFPLGAVAVSHYASPHLAGIVDRAAAIITDVGSPTGHLATIAREYRTPALFGTSDASRFLEQGMDVVVDVEERCIYNGQIALPATLHESGGMESYVANSEASMLRRLLRLIAPLNLVDPNAPSFRMENCYTIHDFIRFCHERAVAELIDFHVSGHSISQASFPVLKADIPIKIRLIDVGGGLSGSPPKGPVDLAYVESLPFRALLKGALDKAVWDQSPASIGARDFLSSLTRPLTMLGHPPSYAGENLAIIAKNYSNLSLRLGYHFNIIDSYLSDIPDDNYVYFRFVGGFAEQGKRLRRAVLISQILTGLHFKVEQKGDLVIGKAKMLEKRHLEHILLYLGKLIAFTRQLDVKMTDDREVARFSQEFLRRISAARLPG